MWVASRVSTVLSEVPNSARRNESGRSDPARARMVSSCVSSADAPASPSVSCNRPSGRAAVIRPRGSAVPPGTTYACAPLEVSKEAADGLGGVNAAGPRASSPGSAQPCSKIGRERPGRVWPALSHPPSAPTTRPPATSPIDATPNRATGFRREPLTHLRALICRPPADPPTESRASWARFPREVRRARWRRPCWRARSTSPRRAARPRQ